MYVNGDWKAYIQTDVVVCPSNQCYIGADPATSDPNFTGGMQKVCLYSGVDYEDHIEAEYHAHGFPFTSQTTPKGYQWDHRKFYLDVGNNGEASYEFQYVDIENVGGETVQGGHNVNFKVAWKFDIDLNFTPDTGYKIKEVKMILLRKNGSEIATVDITGNFYHVYDYPTVKIDNNDYHHCRCEVTFEPQ